MSCQGLMSVGKSLLTLILRRAGYTNIAQGLHWASYSFDHPLTLLGLA